MICKECGQELNPETRVCPFCGASVANSRRVFRGEFKWNTQDFPKAHKQNDISIDWKTGELINRNDSKGLDYSKNFEKKSYEKLNFDFGGNEQEKLGSRNKKSSTPVFDFSPVVGDSRKAIGDENAAKDIKLDLSDDYLSWGEQNAKLVKEKETEKETPARPMPYTEDWTFDEPEPEEPEEKTFTFKSFKPDKDDPFVLRSGVKTKEQVEEERSVLSEFTNMMEAERKADEERDRFAYMSDDERAKADAADEKAGKLADSPEFSFSSIENEYHRYCEENGINPENKEVEIKINEPSGARVTVKTQEIDLAKKSLRMEMSKLRK